MQNKQMRTIVGLLTVCIVALMSAYAQDQKIKVKGLITARTGDTIVLKTTDGSSVTVTLNDDTKVQQPKGLIVAPGAMGEVAPVASNETAAGRADRRVEVKALLNKGVAGS